MKTSDNAFELIMHELLQQKLYLDELVRENEELHSQLANLREGRDILVDILGQRYSLLTDTPVEALATIQMPSITQQAPVATLSEVPTTSVLGAPLAESDHNPEEIAPSPSAEFLEEMILDELASAAATPWAVWTGPATSALSKEEEEKAALRHELTDSYLLE
jgi:hypothetical protein